MAARQARSPTEVAWLVAIPCGLAVLAAAILLVTPVRELLYPSTPPIRLLPEDTGRLMPEPLEGTRYLIALTLPLLLTLATAAVVRRPPWSSGERLRAACVIGAQLIVLGLVVACFVGQHEAQWRRVYFSTATLAIALLVAAGLLWALLRTRPRPATWAFANSRTWRVALAAVALIATALWILQGLNTETSITWSPLEHDIAFHYDETFAVLNGLTPLADFNAQYASLFPYLLALSLLIFGETVLVFTVTACALSVLALMAIYGVLRRAAGSPLVALLLYLPFLATSLFDPEPLPWAPFSAAIYFPMYPFRYAGPCLLAWLVARHLQRPERSRVWLLFTAAGAVILNNVEFGVPAFAGTLAALLATTVEYRGRRLLRFAASVVAGLGVALAALTVLTLLRAGSLPDVVTMARFSRLYAIAGYSVREMPGIIGLPLIIFLTHVAAIATAGVRRLGGADNRVLTGMLAWSGVFGLGASSYYVARSDSSMMVLIFSAWALSLALLTLVVLERPGAMRDYRLSLPALAVLFGFGLAVCSLAEFPSPPTQISRIQRPPPRVVPAAQEWSVPPPRDAGLQHFIASVPRPDGSFVLQRGAPVALFLTTGHRIADAYGVVNVVPFTGPESMHTVREFEQALDALRDAGGTTVLLQRERVINLHQALERRGFRILTQAGIHASPLEAGIVPLDAIVALRLTKWIDTHVYARG